VSDTASNCSHCRSGSYSGCGRRTDDTFADEALKSLPEQFEHGLAGEGGPGRWEVVQDSTATGNKALAQLSSNPAANRFLVAIYKPVDAANVEVTTRFKPVAGKTDQAGGVIVRAVDATNYYIARANVLENNVRFYRVAKGQRQQLASADVKVSAREWHTLTLRAEGDRFTVLFDGKPMHTTADTTAAPRPGRGKVGMWTKSDSVTHFDRVEIKLLP
jgi:3-keto-disaccharide hydrolase